MFRKVKLYGQLAEFVGHKEFEVKVDNVAQAVSFLIHNFPQLEDYMSPKYYQVKVGNYIGVIGFAIQQFAESCGYGVVRDLVGHGIGNKLHEDPQVPNFGAKGQGARIEEGLCIAIEPMINMASPEVYTKKDNWTVCTADGMAAAHFEHSVAVLNNKVKVLTK